MKALILTDGDTFAALNILKCLGAAGVKSRILSGLPMPSYIRVSRYCRGETHFPLTDFLNPPPAAADRINNYCREHQIDVVLPSTMGTTLYLSKIRGQVAEAKVFPLAGNDFLERLNDKWRCAHFFQENQVQIPKTFLAEKAADLAAFDGRYPVVIKQVALDNSHATKIGDPAAAAAYLDALARQRNFPAVIQEFIPGEDVDLSLLADHGKIRAWTIQRWLPDGLLEFIRHPAILEIGQRIVSASEYHGVAHFDMRIDDRDGSIYVLECNPRFWLSIRASLAAGVNFPYLGVLLAIGKPLPAMNYLTGVWTSGLLLTAKTLTGKFSPRYRSKLSLRNAGHFLSDPLPEIIFHFPGLKHRVGQRLENFFTRHRQVRE